MRKLYLIVLLPLLTLWSCDVHEWPELPEAVKLHLCLDYETDMTEWEYIYDGLNEIEQGLGDTYDNRCGSGTMRYVVRTYPVSSHDYVQEFVFTKDIANGYKHEVTLDVLPGNYNVMVWSDLVAPGNNSNFYNTSNFAEISLQGTHTGNTNYRDAFRGSNDILLKVDVVEKLPDTLHITMQRPLAKFEFITSDLQEFIIKEATRLSRAGANDVESAEDAATRFVNIEDYRVVFYYAGFMPYAYNIHADKPVDSKTGVFFESKIDALNDNEASLGFDYVLVNGVKSHVAIQIGLYDKANTRIASSNPINVPLQRDRHTIMRSSYLIEQASGGIVINPEFDGEHNIIIP